MKNPIFKKIIDTIDMENSHKEYEISYEIGCSEFDIHEWHDDKTKRLYSLPYHEWLCTDTHVGIYVILLDDEIVGVSFKPYRKYDTTYYWVDSVSKDKVHQHILSLIPIIETPYNTVNDIPLDILETFERIDKEFDKKYIKDNE